MQQGLRIKTARGGRVGSAGFALAEAIIAIGVTALLMLAIATVAMFTGRNFAALANYVELDDSNRLAMDQMTRDLREANRVTASTTNSLTMEASDGSAIIYSYNSGNRTLMRTAGGVAKVVLRECDRLGFSMGQRNPVGGSYDVYPAATPDTCKVVNVNWSCSRSLFGAKANTESVQTARIVIRKQGT